MKKNRSAIRIPMPLRYVINLILIVAVWFVLNSLIQSGVITSYWSGILITVGINIILATSLNVATGYLGQLPLGHAGFMAVGAYAGGIFMKAMPVQELLKAGNTGAAIPYILLALLISAIVAGIFGIIIGIPAQRLRGDYLAIITPGLRRDHPRHPDEYRLRHRHGLHLRRSWSETHPEVFLVHAGLYLRGRLLLHHPHRHEIPPRPRDPLHPRR